MTAQQHETQTAPHAALTGIRPAGDRAILVELPSLDAVLSLQAQLTAHPQPGQVDVIAAASTVLITTDSPQAAQALAAHVRSLDLEAPEETASTLVTIDVVYDGEDLDEVATLTGLDRGGVVAAHTGQLWTAAFAGFAPGFAYLTGQDSSLEVPRRRTPRTAVPAGAVALGGAYSAVYPRQSPGGWQLIGRTDAAMWDLGRESPALVRPGDTVRFNAIRARSTVTHHQQSSAGAASKEAQATEGLAVRKPGLQSTIQDLGRPGYASLGVSSAGAMDRGALRRANRLVGNGEGDAGIELLFGGLELEALSDQVLAIAGAAVPLEITPADEQRPGEEERTTAVRHPACDAPFALLAGERLTVGTPTAGLRSYVGVRGGLGGPDALGSRSTDTMSGIGPEPLQAGTILPVRTPRPGSIVGYPEVSPLPDRNQATVLRVVPGPRQDWFSGETLQEFLQQEWTVTPQSNRIGLRLNGHALTRSRDGELASEGTVRGAVQVPPEGQPVLFLSDHPVTGGYPVIAVVVHADLDKAAQLPPGTTVRFAAMLPAELPKTPKESPHA
ncbi:5-oxoprolinase/urea amidolyase family protein [Pseudarthrobacter sp902506025]|uniref:KipI family sensor histidine kinase inhibitor n=1 Tax=Pseudarthrobacter defluvii TaxID=410837 RepID=A0ABT9UHW4_9MICC|nr:5-oxoprolinase/urea amidolyase family protein [Pseudarthrobacter defluvii]MDQ0118004.1 KipI family sensor histidine kinase inhibitor [Pseudarthrobacter defluvii]